MSILEKDFLDKYKNVTPPWGWNGLGLIVYKRTYSRPKPDGTFEEWPETIARCINGSQDIGADYTEEEAERLFDLIFNLKCSYAGRMLWMLGTEHIKRWGGNALLNCWGVSITNIEDFCFVFENLMLGGGVGFSVKREDIHELPKVKEDVCVSHIDVNDADFIVPDSREGWVNLLRRVLQSYFYTGKGFIYSTQLIRAYGTKINGLGGTASGPSILVEGITEICKVLDSREGKKLRSIDVLDICNIIGSIVVSGNIRRSALAGLGDPDDYLYLRAKRWDLGGIPKWRQQSNNSLYIDDFSHIQNDVWEGYVGNGECYGFFNVKLARKIGRIGEPRKDVCEVINPCFEIPLANKECCCLSEIYLNNISSKEELFDCAKLLYKTQKAICNLNFIHEETTKIVHKNRRIGVGVTGVCQSLNKLEWLDDCYKALRELDKEWSKKKSWPESIRLTTLKPSGTVSLLSGSTPGIHPAYSKYFIRRIQMSFDDKLVSICKNLGYNVEYKINLDGTIDQKNVVIEFPCFSGKNVLVAEEMSAIKQLEMVKKLQTIWSDNAVSVSVYYKKEELNQIKEWLKENYKENIKSVSFLLHKEHGFKQAPYEEITEDKYNELVSKVKPIVNLNLEGDKEFNVEECKGSCPIK